MKATKIRFKGKKPTNNKMVLLMATLRREFQAAGFITDVQPANSQAIQIGLHMRSFSIDINKLGYNARVNSGGSMSYYPVHRSVAGWKRTNIPTWDQRVEFNNIVNEVFDSHSATANIKSGVFTVRTVEDGAWNEGHWSAQIPDGVDIYAIVPLTEDMEDEAKEKRRAVARERRQTKAVLANQSELAKAYDSHLQGRTNHLRLVGDK